MALWEGEPSAIPVDDFESLHPQSVERWVWMAQVTRAQYQEQDGPGSRAHLGHSLRQVTLGHKTHLPVSDQKPHQGHAQPIWKSVSERQLETRYSEI